MENRIKIGHKKRFLFLISILAVLIAVSGYLYYLKQGNTIRNGKYSELKAIAELKINQLVQWRKERIGNARSISRAPFFVQGVEEWFLNKTNIELKEIVVKRLVTPQKEYGYESIILASVKGEPLLSLGSAIDRFDSVTSENIINVAKHDSIVFSDFYYCKLENKIHYDICVPLINKKHAAIAVLVFRINPYDYLYPLLQTWSTPSTTSEALIVRKDGDNVMFLNELRFHTGAALSFRLPLTQKELPAVQAVLGYEGIVEGKDYRGVEVLADVRPVPGTSWFMVTKVDRSEIYSDLYEHAIIVSVFTVLSILLSSFGLMWIYHYRQRNIYRTLWQTQEEFRTTLYSIGDAVITTDRRGRVQHLNIIAEQLTGWKEDDAKNKPLEEVFHIINEETRIKAENPFQLVLRKGHVVGLANHTLLISKDGKEISIADSGSPIRNEEGEIVGVVLVLRDQTEERRKQKALEESEERFRLLFDQAPLCYQSLDINGNIIHVNQIWLDTLGYSKEEVLGRWFGDFLAHQCVDGFRQSFPIFKASGKIQSEFQMIHKNGSQLLIAFEGRIGYDLEGNFKQTHGILQNMTEKRRAEEVLRESEKRFSIVFQASPIAISVTHLLDGKINDINPAFMRMFGYTREELIGYTTLELKVWAHSEDRDQVVKVLREQNEVRNIEKQFRKKSGEIGTLLVSADVVNIEGERYLLSIMHDITDRKRAEAALRESEERYRVLFEVSADGILIAEIENGKFLYANPAIYNMFGYTKEQLTKMCVADIHPQNDLPRVIEEFNAQARGEKVLAPEIPCLRKDKTVFYADINTVKVLIDGKECNMGLFRDVTERKRTQIALQESELKLRNIFEHSTNLFYSHDTNHVLHYLSPQIKDILGFEVEEALVKWTELISDNPINEIGIQKTVKAIETGEAQEPYELEVIHKTGKKVWVEVREAPVVENGKTIAIVGSLTDITERKRAEEELQHYVMQYRSLTENSPDLIARFDRQCRHLYVNTTAAKAGVYSAEEYVGKTIVEVGVPEQEAKKWEEHIRTAFETGRIVDVEDAFKTPHGLRYFSTKFVPEFAPDGSVHSVQSIARDITERKKTEEALRESETKYRELIDGMNETVWVIDFNGNLIDVNNTAVEVLGYSKEELLTIGLCGIDASLKKEDIQELAKAMPSDKVQIFETSHKTKDGRTFPVEVYSSLVTYQGKNAILSIARDIAERKQTEDQLRQMQKLEGLGTLAGGIAHDFNNILGIILAYVTSIQRCKDDTQKLDIAADTIMKAVERGKTLVQQVLTFARKTETEFGPVNVNDVVMEIMVMIFETFPKVLTYSQNFDKGIPYIHADRSQLHQALLNLCVNARDAMPSGGVLTINTRMVAGLDLRNQHANAFASSYVCIEVSDTGVGMAPEIRSRIFEPFYTTKEHGKGTGLGLAVVFGVVQTHKGFIDVESDFGQGTTFRLYIPALSVAPPRETLIDETVEMIPGGTETLLLVEDEEAMMIPLQTVLVEKGYNILSADDGKKALKIYKERKDDIALVLTDLGLPNMTGMEECQKIKRINPNARIIVATGFLDPEMKLEFLKAGIQHFLYKPYDIKEVLKIVRQVLDDK